MDGRSESSRPGPIRLFIVSIQTRVVSNRFIECCVRRQTDRFSLQFEKKLCSSKPALEPSAFARPLDFLQVSEGFSGLAGNHLCYVVLVLLTFLTAMRLIR
jgi:hypothetical protein